MTAKKKDEYIRESIENTTSEGLWWQWKNSDLVLANWFWDINLFRTFPLIYTVGVRRDIIENQESRNRFYGYLWMSYDG